MTKRDSHDYINKRGGQIIVEENQQNPTRVIQAPNKWSNFKVLANSTIKTIKEGGGRKRRRRGKDFQTYFLLKDELRWKIKLQTLKKKLRNHKERGGREPTSS